MSQSARQSSLDNRGRVVAGRFRIEEEAGQGGAGTVYLATDMKTGDRVALKVLRGVLDDRAGMEEAWRRGVFCELGAGDVDLAAFFAELEAVGYEGWLVVEQDHFPDWDGGGLARAVADQRENRSWLEARLR